MKNNNTPKTPDSKLSKFPEYKNEYTVNKEIFDKIVISHINQLDVNDPEFYPYIRYRVTDMLVSVTDDLIRYARYHNIGTDIRNDTNEEVYSISENVRAAFFSKWILKLRPCILDALAETGTYHSSIEGGVEAAEKIRQNQFLPVTFCNEHLALISLSTILNIKYADADEVVEFERFFNGVDLATVYYTLRYRLCHQDTYSLLFSKIFTFCDEEDFRIILDE